MTSPDSPDVRIGDREREEAIKALGEHFSAGRLDIDEYGERTGQITAARTREDLRALFADLPEPHPRFWSAHTVTPPESSATPLPREHGSPARRAAAAGMSLSWIAGIMLLVTTHSVFWIFLPIALSVVFSALWGRGWRRH